MPKKIKRDENLAAMQVKIFQELKASFLSATAAVIAHQIADHCKSEHDAEVMQQIGEALTFALQGIEPDTSDGNWGLPPEKWTGPEDYETASHGD